MGLPLFFQVAGLALSAFGAVKQVQAGRAAEAAGERQEGAAKDSAAEQRAQFASQQRIADVKNARERATMARQGRVARANLAAGGANSGVPGSSGVLGGTASIGTQTAAGLGIFGAVEAGQRDINESQSRQADSNLAGGIARGNQIQAQADVSSAQGIFSLGVGIFDKSGGFKTIFGKD